MGLLVFKAAKERYLGLDAILNRESVLKWFLVKALLPVPKALFGVPKALLGVMAILGIFWSSQSGKVGSQTTFFLFRHHYSILAFATRGAFLFVCWLLYRPGLPSNIVLLMGDAAACPEQRMSGLVSVHF